MSGLLFKLQIDAKIATFINALALEITGCLLVILMYELLVLLSLDTV